MRCAGQHRAGGPRTEAAGFALLMVLGFMAVSFLIISGVLYSTSNAALQTDRHQRYYSTQEAATAAAEYAVAQIITNMHAGGRQGLSLPSDTTLESAMETRSEWTDFEFQMQVSSTRVNQYSELLWKYRGLTATNDVYRVRAGARTLDLDLPIASVVEQEIQVADIPIFNFMGYSAFDLTFVSVAANDITINGRMHSNRKIYLRPSGPLRFTDDLTAADEIRSAQHPADTAVRVSGELSLLEEVDSQVNTMRLNPRYGPLESADLLTRIVTHDDHRPDVFVVVNHGLIEVLDSLGSAFDPALWTNSISVTNFFDARQLRTVQATQIELGELCSQLGLTGGLIYMYDVTTTYTTEELAGFRLVDGVSLPVNGLSVVTTNALYIKGNYNSVNRVPAMLAADAVTLLSDAWDDTGTGAAVDTTLNAAVLTGTVPSDELSGVFDGGYFNAIRLLENWNGRTMTFRGSIATPFASRDSNEPWRGDYYWPPSNRIYLNEPMFLTATGLPKGTPILQAVIRGQWELLPPTELF